MKTSLFTAVLTLSVLGLGINAHAARNNVHSVEIFDAVQIGTTELRPGNYKIKWQGTGPAVEVRFLQNGKTVVTITGTLKTNDDEVTQDGLVTEAIGTGPSTLKEIRFGRQKGALVFEQHMGGM